MSRRFPEGFLWGTATSAFQIEMGRGDPSSESDWYVWVHDEENIEKGIVSGDLPEEGPGSWQLFSEDFRLARKELCNNAIRLSVDWTRIFPRSTEDVVVDVQRDKLGNVCEINIREEQMHELMELADYDAIKGYREMLSEAKKVGLTVMLTVYHWPLPLWLHDPIGCREDVGNSSLRGWLDQRTIVEFGKFSAYIAHAFGDLVDLYATINEPRIVSQHGYLSDPAEFPPGLYDPELFLVVLKNLSIAHGVSYKLLKRWDNTTMSDLGPATVGVVCVLQYFEPENSENSLDITASNFVEYLYNEWFLNSIFRGDYDLNLDGVIQPEEQRPQMVKGCDFIGLNYYARWKVRHKVKGGDPKFDYEFTPCVGDCTDYGWEIYPKGIRYVLDWAYQRFRRPIYVTENGISDADDGKRERYLLEHLKQLLDAIEIDKVPVKGYFHWSLIDNFEWADGFNMRFGLFNVDSETKERTPKESVQIYREIAKSNMLPDIKLVGKNT